MIGCGQRRIAFTTSPVIRVKASSSGIFIWVSGPMISNTSPPEQKLPPAPVMTTALMVRIVRQCAERVAQFCIAVESERVFPLRPVERDSRDLARDLPTKMPGRLHWHLTPLHTRRRSTGRSLRSRRAGTGRRPLRRLLPAVPVCPAGLLDARAGARILRRTSAWPRRSCRGAGHHVGVGEAGTDRIHGDAVPYRFQRQRAGETDQCVLRRDIGGDVGITLQAGRAGDVDDAPETCGAHVRQHCLTGGDRGQQIDRPAWPESRSARALRTVSRSPRQRC